MVFPHSFTGKEPRTAHLLILFFIETDWELADSKTPLFSLLLKGAREDKKIFIKTETRTTRNFPKANVTEKTHEKLNIVPSTFRIKPNSSYVLFIIHFSTPIQYY